MAFIITRQHVLHTHCSDCYNYLVLQKKKKKKKKKKSENAVDCFANTLSGGRVNASPKESDLMKNAKNA